jgi:hypothetical protein
MGWSLTPDDKVSNRFAEAVAYEIVPALGEIPYDRATSAIKLKVKQHAKNVLGVVNRYNKRLLTGVTFKHARVQADEHLMRFWNEVFFAQRNHFWRELIDEPMLRRMLDSNPSTEVLWNIATVEIVGQTHCA